MKFLNGKSICWCTILIFIAFSSIAQIQDKYKIAFKDSVELEKNARIASNTILIKNSGRKVIRLGIKIILPRYWKEIKEINTKDLLQSSLKPGETKSVSINLLGTSKVVAKWDSVKIKVWDYNGDTNNYFFLIKIKEKADYSLEQYDEEQNLLENNENIIKIKFSIKNTGNVDDEYYINSISQSLGINDALHIRLNAGKDSMIELNARIKHSIWKKIYRDYVTVSVVSLKTKKSKNLVFNVYKPTSRLNQNARTHETAPLTIGGGLLANGPNITYFGQIQGTVKYKDHNLSFNYRSKDFGPEAYTYQPNALYANYRYKKFHAEAGKIQGPKNFYTAGQGVSIGVVDKKFGISVSGMKFANYSIRLSKNNDLYGNIFYYINHIRVDHVIEANFDTYYGINSYLLNNELQIIKTKDIRFKASATAGYEDKLISIPNISKITWGYGAAYQFNAHFKKWQINSNVKYNSSDYPGIYKGVNIENHEIRYNLKKYYLIASCVLNALQKNTLRDTLYNSDFLSTNNIKFGGGFGYFKQGMYFNVLSGILKQNGNTFNTLGDGSFIDGSFQFLFGTNNNISITSNNAFNPQVDNTILFTTNSIVSLVTKFFNFTGGYNRIPIPSEKNPDLFDYTETINGGPGVTFSLFNKSLNATFRYTIAKTISEQTIRNGVGGQLSYSKNGFSIGIGGFYPLKDPSNITIPISETKYGTMYFSQRINVPVRKIKLYNLTLTLFKDENDNSKYDEGEQLLDSAIVSIDNKIFLSDLSGEIRYKHVTPGAYYIGFVNSKYNDLVAENGVVQVIDLKDDTDLIVPFKKGKKLFGNLNIVKDSLSNASLSPDKFKVIITDTLGRAYSSLTDPSGNFYIYIPEGIYTVSLNPEAFSGSDFKPERISYTVDMFKKEDAFVQFVVRQKKRKMIFIDSDKK